MGYGFGVPDASMITMLTPFRPLPRGEEANSLSHKRLSALKKGDALDGAKQPLVSVRHVGDGQDVTPAAQLGNGRRSQTCRLRSALAKGSVMWYLRTRSRYAASGLRPTRRPRCDVVHYSPSAQAARTGAPPGCVALRQDAQCFPAAAPIDFGH